MGRAVIQVRRDGSMRDALRAYKVVVDGETRGKIKRGKSISIDVEPGAHEVHMKLDWTKSSSVDLSLAEGEEARLVCSPSKSAAAITTVADATIGKDSYITLERE
jgi:predicted molibdopterin-dependent oxidoreductase YjgC